MHQLCGKCLFHSRQNSRTITSSYCIRIWITISRATSWKANGTCQHDAYQQVLVRCLCRAASLHLPHERCTPVLQSLTETVEPQMAQHRSAAIEEVQLAAPPASEAGRATTAVPTAPPGPPAIPAVSALLPAPAPLPPSLRPAQLLPPAPAIDPALAVTPPPQARAGSSEGPSFSPLLAGPGGHEVPLTQPPEAAPPAAIQEPVSASVPFPPRPPGLAVRDALLAAGPAAVSGESAPYSRGRGDSSTFIQAAKSAALEQVPMYR